MTPAARTTACQRKTAATATWVLAPRILNQRDHFPADGRQQLFKPLVTGNQMSRTALWATQGWQALPTLRIGRLKYLRLVIEKARFAPVGNRQLLDHVNLKRIRPAPAHIGGVNPGQGFQLLLHIHY